MLIAQSQLQTGKVEDCLITMERHIKDLTFDSSAQYLTALAYFLSNDLNKSHDYASAASKLNPEFAEPHFILGKIHFLRNELKLAREYKLIDFYFINNVENLICTQL